MARTCAGGPNNEPPPCNMCESMEEYGGSMEYGETCRRNSPCPRPVGRPGIGIQHPLGTV